MKIGVLSIMVRLKNIVINDDFLECDIFPEDSENSGHLKVERETGDIVSYNLPKNYEECINHVYHAKYALEDLSHKKEVPSEKVVMWY